MRQPSAYTDCCGKLVWKNNRRVYTIGMEQAEKELVAGQRTKDVYLLIGIKRKIQVEPAPVRYCE